MKKIILSAPIILFFLAASAQEFPGYRTGAYTGVNGVFFNPANIADSRYRFDINLFSFNMLAGNDNASFNLKNISESFDEDKLKDQLFGKDAGPSSAQINLDFHGPSFMLNIGKKNAIAFTSRARLFVNAMNIDGKLANKLSEDFENDPDLPYTLSSKENMRLALNGWSEYGFSFARVISQQGAHFFKGGITLKYLSGAGNTYMNINNFNGTIDDDNFVQKTYLANTTGRIAVGIGGINISDFQVSDLLNSKSSGLGGDIGFVYEYRPGGKKYKFKLGASLMDIGKIKYEKDADKSGAYDIHITNAQRLYLEELAEQDLENYNDFFLSHPQYFTPVGSLENTYTVSLPTTLQVDADLNILGGLYVSLAGQIALNGSDDKVFNNYAYSAIAITPRYEGKRFGVYLPLHYNELSKMNAGLSLRMGPLFIGSGSILTALAGNAKQADIHLGVRFGGLKKN